MADWLMPRCWAMSHIQDLDAGGVPKELEELRQVVEDLFVGHLGVHLFHDVLVDLHRLAPLQRFPLVHLSSPFRQTYELLFICNYMLLYGIVKGVEQLFFGKVPWEPAECGAANGGFPVATAIFL